MTFREIEYGSPAFRDGCELRNRMLWLSVGLNLFEANLDHERQELHFGLFDDDTLLACVIAVPISPNVAKIRQMAVSPTRQGRGCGRSIIQDLEKNLAGKGFRHLFMHARLTAAVFYEKLGYLTTGPEFLEVGLPHVRMEKVLP